LAQSGHRSRGNAKTAAGGTIKKQDPPAPRPRGYGKPAKIHLLLGQVVAKARRKSFYPLGSEAAKMDKEND
jgi:hypothetical protein